MDDYRQIGRIVRLQIQRKSLKQTLEPKPGSARSPERYYDPVPILAGEQLWIAESVAAMPRGDEVVMDVHCAAHPNSRNRGSGNMFSIGFTSHYDKMREEFGEHLSDGIAGENLLVETMESFEVEDLSDGLVVRGLDGAEVEFGEVAVAAPCVEFSRFCLANPYADPGPTSEALRFLDGGTRGFYAWIATGLPAMLRTGDVLLLKG